MGGGGRRGRHIVRTSVGQVDPWRGGGGGEMLEACRARIRYTPTHTLARLHAGHMKCCMQSEVLHGERSRGLTSPRSTYTMALSKATTSHELPPPNSPQTAPKPVCRPHQRTTNRHFVFFPANTHEILSVSSHHPCRQADREERPTIKANSQRCRMC